MEKTRLRERKKKVQEIKEKIILKKVNDIKVQGIPKFGGTTGVELPSLGHDFFVEPYPNVMISARKQSGKTWVMYEILKGCIDKDTVVIFFVSTLNRDENYLTFRAYLKYR